ncbi:NAD(P)H-quinone oxidoreductase subunit F [Gloeomargarita lithophora Alchichica-D10]|uniref:NAD(P)H-quinone oxidoreductase subunit F n=1 Tax=Gloeomargarita lithophora Alchichica-D10 TaxID=1188229 RepID=A0A1J0AD51_9CYAN|nr:NAD(P)H-quinone oxidoreductase subunit F [Gloeomargarita lithophora]APB33840.1 NAD(P)H-quinone oxidoreductase subunit F [Gloeomargarita lithophora Alchichica-D10]
MLSWFLESVWLVPLYPFVGTVIAALWFPGIIRRTGPRPAGYVNALMTGVVLVHGGAALLAVWGREPLYYTVPWLQVAGLDLSLPLVISPVSVTAMVVVLGVNFLAQIYAFGYLENDWGWARFFALMAFFEAGMCALALCDSLFFGYMILELLTLGTYLLVGFWLAQPLAVTGARDAFLTKRVGDLFLLMGVLALWPLAKTWNFTELTAWAQAPTTGEYAQLHPGVLFGVGLALLAGPLGKCAQFPFHLWLDEAMEGLIPATILRNTVVTATGAWVLVKMQPVLALSPGLLNLMVLMGAVTAVGAALIAIAQVDVKRTLSYPVSSYMGLVLVAVGTGHGQTGLLLLLVYGLAAGLPVMAVGNVIWNSITQNVTQLGGLWTRRPITGLSFLVGLAGLVALPPLGGFWVLLQLLTDLGMRSPVLVAVVLGVNGLLTFNFVRVFCLLFGNRPQAMSERSPELHWPFVLPMTVLAGVVLHVPQMLAAAGVLPAWQADGGILLILSTLSGITLASVIYLSPGVSRPITLPWVGLQDWLAQDLYTPRIYKMTVVGLVDVISRLTDVLDRYLVDGLVNLVGLAAIFSGETLKYSTSGKFQWYLLTILLGLGLVVGLMVVTLS